LFPRFSDLALSCGVAIAVYALVGLGTDVRDAAAEAANRFPKHAFFAIVASLWMGLQFAAQQTMQVWESWRGDAVWRAGLRGSTASRDGPLNAGIFLYSLFTGAVLGGAVRTIFGIAAFLAVGCSSGWIACRNEFPWFPTEAATDLVVACALAGLYGTAWGFSLACGLSAVDLRWHHRAPRQFVLALMIPLVVLAHLILSARFLDLKDGFGGYDIGAVVANHWTTELARLVPTNQLARVTEAYNMKRFQSNLTFEMCLPALLASLALLLGCAWPAATALLTSKEIREK
jgi:hypothetical protein